MTEKKRNKDALRLNVMCLCWVMVSEWLCCSRMCVLVSSYSDTLHRRGLKQRFPMEGLIRLTDFTLMVRLTALIVATYDRTVLGLAYLITFHSWIACIKSDVCSDASARRHPPTCACLA